MGSSSSKQERRRDSVIQNELKKEKFCLLKEHKILFVGSERSGKKTIFKQLENIYFGGSYSKKQTLNSYDNSMCQLEIVMDDSKIKLIHPNMQKTNWRKYIQYFDDITAVIFVASLSCYDIKLSYNGLDLLVDGYINNVCGIYNVPDCLTNLIIKFCDVDTQNAMTQQLNLFNDICNHHIFKKTPIILLLNKMDLFAEKIIDRKISLTKCPSFTDYDGTLNELEQPIEYVRNAFLSLNYKHKNRYIFTHEICGIDPDILHKVLYDIQHIDIQTSLMYSGLMHN